MLVVICLLIVPQEQPTPCSPCIFPPPSLLLPGLLPSLLPHTPLVSHPPAPFPGPPFFLLWVLPAPMSPSTRDPLPFIRLQCRTFSSQAMSLVRVLIFKVNEFGFSLFPPVITTATTISMPPLSSLRSLGRSVPEVMLSSTKSARSCLATHRQKIFRRSALSTSMTSPPVPPRSSTVVSMPSNACPRPISTRTP